MNDEKSISATLLYPVKVENIPGIRKVATQLLRHS